MGFPADRLLSIRGGLCESIDRLAHELPHLSTDQLCSGIDAIRRTALDYGIDPVAQLARGLESLLAENGARCMVLSWLDTMRDAAGCERIDAEASAAWLASVHIRMAS